eukprot:GHVU01061016.1.p1 GENE.GHVU01061016.1~~GHVU01061016.1.p1  ORF type:complete len:106 (+),score=9.52 GHVU01061016.1:341-658(+)
MEQASKFDTLSREELVSTVLHLEKEMTDLTLQVDRAKVASQSLKDDIRIMRTYSRNITLRATSLPKIGRYATSAPASENLSEETSHGLPDEATCETDAKVSSSPS